MVPAFISAAAPAVRDQPFSPHASHCRLISASAFTPPSRASLAPFLLPPRPTAATPHMTAGSERGDKVLEGPFDGAYGQWYFTQSDADGVFTYRVALACMGVCTAAATFVALTAGLHAPPALYDALYVANLAAFGVALQTIHIYVKPLHNALRALWAMSVVGSLALYAGALADGGLVVGVYTQPALLLAVGWQFVALTGLFVKEAFCFGRSEAVALIGLVPLLSGGHFLGLSGARVEGVGAAVAAGLFLFFCARKFAQPATADLGDLSVFEHLAKGGTL